jgi:glucosyl-dolichyl phosphate glucuronosyltransferase
MNAPDISIVVCTRNRAAMLRGALASLYDLATDPIFSYEIVVVDNGSTDETPQVAKAASAESRQPLRYIHEPMKGIVPARNSGIREARGRWVAFFDDDQLADRRWLAELYRGAREKNARVVGGSVHLKLPEGCIRRLHPAVRMLLGEAKLSDEPRPYGGRLTPGCGNLMIERTVFERVGVFERTVSGRGEDTDLFSRIERAGVAAWYLPSAIVHHLTPNERLADDYILKLARGVGEGVALRQAELRGKAGFALLWLGKACRWALVQAPLTAFSKFSGDHESWLGRRALLMLNASFLRKGWELLWPSRRCPQESSAAETSLCPDFQPRPLSSAPLVQSTKDFLP